MGHRVELTPWAQRELRRLPRDLQERLEAPILALGENPRPAGVRKLQGQENAWRIRVGQYRVVYNIHDDRALVVILKVAVGARLPTGDSLLRLAKLKGNRSGQYALRHQHAILGVALALVGG